jgi:hypothetical protein
VRAERTIRKRQREKGIALLIAIFILLLIGVVAIALIVSSGTETALAGNYRLSTGVYYAAVAGLEEARARLRSNNPNSFSNTAPGFLPSPLGVCSPVYVINSVGGETVAPWDPNSTYPDNEFGQEFAGICGALPNPSPSTLSVWNRSPLNGLPFPGPLYKWVRINGVSEQSLHLDTGPNFDGIDSKLVYFDGTNLNDTLTGKQVLEITALAVLPNGSQQPTQKLLQYLVAPAPITLPPFAAALTLAGSTTSSVVSYAGTSDNGFKVKGVDQDCNGALTGLLVPSIGVFSNADVGPVTNGIPAGPIRNNNYPGLMSSPDVEVVTFPPNVGTPSGLSAVVQTIIANADATVPSASASSFLSSLVTSSPSQMSATSPMSVVVNGNLDLTGWNYTGYGLLLVTGNLQYDGNASWNGIIMVVGQGTVTGNHSGSGEINGAVLLAKTLGATDPNFGNSSVDFSSPPHLGGEGIRYSACWIQKSLPTATYKILSFHEIAQ